VFTGKITRYLFFTKVCLAKKWGRPRDSFGLLDAYENFVLQLAGVIYHWVQIGSGSIFLNWLSFYTVTIFFVFVLQAVINIYNTFFASGIRCSAQSIIILLWLLALYPDLILPKQNFDLLND